MRTIIVSGNLAADPEILSRPDGTNYTKLRIGNHEYSDGKDGATKWFTAFYGRTDGIINALKKGSGVVVMGDYQDNIYQSQTKGADIDRIISAYKIDFFSTGKRDDSQPGQPQAAPVAAPEAKPAKKGSTKAPTPAPQPDGVDDLPF
ncbi:MAG: single-stranded DNA-binding protein [Bacteroidales bacterium]|nr:single-stranded DNA-binding protein [Bacteroidales bacterium]